MIALSLLPSAADDTSLRKNFPVLVSRVLAKYFSFFKFTVMMLYSGTIIMIFFSTEMSKKSIVVSLCCCYVITLISGMVFL